MIECSKCGKTKELYCPAKKMSDFRALIEAEYWTILGDWLICPECTKILIENLEEYAENIKGAKND